MSNIRAFMIRSGTIKQADMARIEYWSRGRG